MRRPETSRHQRCVATPRRVGNGRFFWRVTLLASRLRFSTMSSPTTESPSSSSPCRPLSGEGNQVKNNTLRHTIANYCVRLFLFDTKQRWWPPLGKTEASPAADSAGCWSTGRGFYPEGCKQSGETLGTPRSAWPTELSCTVLLLCDVLRLFLCAGDALFGTIHYGETIVWQAEAAHSSLSGWPAGGAAGGGELFGQKPEVFNAPSKKLKFMNMLKIWIE